MQHFGLSRSHGEVSSFGTLRLAFWNDNNGCDDDGEFVDDYEGSGSMGRKMGEPEFEKGKKSSDVSTSYASLSASSTVSTSTESSVASSTLSQGPLPTIYSPEEFRDRGQKQQHDNFLPSMTPTKQPPASNNNFDATGKSPLTPLFDQGCIRNFSPARSPFFPSHTQQQQQKQQQPNNQTQIHQQPSSSGLNKDWDAKPSATASPQKPKQYMPGSPPSKSAQQYFGPPPPRHYAKEQFKSSTVNNDSNPIWGDAGSFSPTARRNNGGHDNENVSSFHIPLKKDDFLPTLRTDGGKVGLEIRLDEEMAATESLLVGGALSTAVGAATAATSVVGLGGHAQNVSNMGMEMLGLSTDRLIGRGYVDLMPLLLGLWEESWDQSDSKSNSSHGNVAGKGGDQHLTSEDAILNEYGKINPDARGMRRRVERMGMLDVWIPLYHPTATTKASSSSNGDKNGTNSEDESNKQMESSGMIHLLISYEPNGMSPKRDDIIAFESFARRPLSHEGGANIGPVITPIVPPLSPLLVIEVRGQYLLLEYITSRTVTSVDRNGNVKSSRWERPHRVRIHRSAAFVIERSTFMDAAGNIARLPGDIVLSTPIGQEIADVSAPIVAGAMELVGPALLYGKLMMAAGGTGIRAGMAGLSAATSAVVYASQEKALERRSGGGGGGEAGVYGFGE